ncbi:hypothetical protein M409DRAFT_29517 [Zasmidium cellare ATCC 36951]|uniref:Ubiquitin-like protease family profile domain-containing protein n=1 Tax=Zasmidium cellare ATCC 36951 TaxID=1080233 RepID=A0A6A6C2I9_ZASCE|nr:uncharacterized protein M409DRAFT_29517 [Zasmidium cellare ATCC 36951]KAF2160072.1 hypothetical protein M409DRAFT_29517 [Zasmidium cellare ATCC 36951]
MSDNAPLQPRIAAFERTLAATDRQAQLNEFCTLARLVLDNRTPQQPIPAALADAFTPQALKLLDRSVLDLVKSDRNKHAGFRALAKVSPTDRHPAAVEPHVIIALLGLPIPSRRFVQVFQPLCRRFGLDQVFSALLQARATDKRASAGWEYRHVIDAESALRQNDEVNEEEVWANAEDGTRSVESESVAAPEQGRRDRVTPSRPVHDDSLMDPLEGLVPNVQDRREDGHDVEHEAQTPLVIEHDRTEDNEDWTGSVQHGSDDDTAFLHNDEPMPAASPARCYTHHTDSIDSNIDSDSRAVTTENAVDTPQTPLSSKSPATQSTMLTRRRPGSIHEDPKVANTPRKRRMLRPASSTITTHPMSSEMEQIQPVQPAPNVSATSRPRKTSGTAGSRDLMGTTSTIMIDLPSSSNKPTIQLKATSAANITAANTTATSTRTPTTSDRPETSLAYAIHSCSDGQWMSSTAIFDILDAFNPDPDRIVIVESGFLDVDRPAVATQISRVRQFTSTHTILIVPLYVPHNHWSVAIFLFDVHTVVLYDPLRKDRVCQKARQVVEHFVDSDFIKFRTDDGIQWEIEDNQAGLRQTNTLDCGVYTIIVALATAADRDLPREVCPALWRRAFRECLRALGRYVPSEDSRTWEGCWKEVVSSVPAFQPRTITSLEELIDFTKNAIDEERISLAQQIEHAKTLVQECLLILELAEAPIAHQEPMLEGLRRLVRRERKVFDRYGQEEPPSRQPPEMLQLERFPTLRAMKAARMLMEGGKEFFAQAAEMTREKMEKLAKDRDDMR